MLLRMNAGLLLLLAVALPGMTQDAPVATEEEGKVPRVVPVLDPGSHTSPICALGLSRDKSKLITVGKDSTVQVWSTATGERLDILRLPSYGHEQTHNAKAWEVAAVSADGQFAAIGGGQKLWHAGDDGLDRAKLLIIDVQQRSVRPVIALKGVVTALAFTPDGDGLAVAVNAKKPEIHVFSNIRAKPKRTVRPRQSQTLADPEAEHSPTILAFSPDGQRLIATDTTHKIVVWNLSGAAPRVETRLELEGHTTAICWSPDSKRFARAFMTYKRNPRGFEVRSVDGKQEQERIFANEEAFHRGTEISSMAFTDPQTLLLCSDDGPEGPRQGSTSVRYDLSSGKAGKLLQEDEAGPCLPLGAISQDCELAALTVSMGLDAIVYRVKDGKPVARCGAASPVPTVVGWGKQDLSTSFAWSESPKRGRHNADPADLQFAFDLARMEPRGEMRPAEYGVMVQSLGTWSVGRNSANEFNIQHGGQPTGSVLGGNGISAITLVPQAKDPPLALWASRFDATGSATLRLSRTDGTLVAQLRPKAVYVRDLAPSPDGRFVIVSTGTHRMCVYATDGSEYPLLSVARINGQWVAWSGDGYYTASPGGEKMFGWSVSNGASQLATFHPAETFARHFRRPDLLRRAIELGSIERALKTIESRAPKVEQILPPTCELKLLKQTGPRVQVQAAATSDIKDMPVTAIRVLLDGRPLAHGAGQKTVAQGELAAAIWEFDIPTGIHELKLLAKSEENSAVSAPLLVTGPKSAVSQPVLHRLCVGVNQYDLSPLNLAAAAKDATDTFKALNEYCVGPENRFGTAQGTLLVDQQATRSAVLKALGEIRKAAKPGDLVVFLFAGHGVKQQDDYYLLTREADPNASLQGRSLSGEDLRRALSDMECPVLLMLDACHSAQGVKSLRPATDDLTRSLTDDATGVTVLAAAMAHETASATAENGYFTAAVIKALQAGKGVPFDPHDHVLYAHHIYSVVFSEVRKATGGKQNPFLNMPWTVPPLALREVPQQ